MTETRQIETLALVRWLADQGASDGLIREAMSQDRNGRVAVRVEVAESHVRVVRSRPGRRLLDPVQHSETLCGAPITAIDLTPQDAKADLRAGWRYLGCEKCRSLVERSEADREARTRRAVAV